MVRGRFITLEGGEGAGKSTQIRLLAETLRARGLTVVTTREPGGSPGAEAIRELLVNGEPGRWTPLTEALLLNAARHQHLVETIRPALTRGDWIVCDRYADSTMAYQGYGHGLDRHLLMDLHRIATDGLEPDLTLILDIDPEVGMRRALGRQQGEDRFERMDPGFHQRLRQGFLEIASAQPHRCVVIDAGGPVERIRADILRHVDARLGSSA